MKKKIFYPWNPTSPEEWIKENKDTVRVLGQIQSQYKPCNSTAQKDVEYMTTVLYEEK